MARRGTAPLVALALVAALRGVVAAQPAPPGQPGQPGQPGPADEIEMDAVKDPKVARRWLTTAQQLMQRGTYFAARGKSDDAKLQFRNAVTAYLKAIDAGDDVNVYLDLAIAEEKLGKLDDAVKHVRRVVDATAGVRSDVARRAAAKLEELGTRIGVVTLKVTPPGASITLGGAELGTAPLPEPLVLMPGTYTLSFQAGGYQPKEAELKVEPGSETERSIELEPIKVVVAPVKQVTDDSTPAPPPPPPARGSRAPLYIAAGVTGAAAIGAGVFGALALREHGTFTGASTAPAAREDARTAGRQFALISDISLATAAVAAGFTVYWYVFRDGPRTPGPKAAKLDVVPWVQPSSGGAMIAGRF